MGTQLTVDERLKIITVLTKWGERFEEAARKANPTGKFPASAGYMRYPGPDAAKEYLKLLRRFRRDAATLWKLACGCRNHARELMR